MNFSEIKLDEVSLPPTMRLRPVQWSDVEAVAQLIYDVCEADGDTTVAVTPAELKLEWQNPGFKLERDAFLVETSDGRIVGYEEFGNQHEHALLQTDGYVHPEFKGLGIGTTLLRVIEKRAREEMALAEPDVRVSLRSGIDNRDPSSHKLHRNESYQPLRYHWRMEIQLTEPPQPVTFPNGIELRPFVRAEHSRAVLDAQNEAFRDHWGSHDMSFEVWEHRKFARKDFDPSLWMIAWDGDEIAGFSQNRYRMGIGWIGTLGVRRPWRKRGLGEALLLRSFGEFYRRGTKTIGLGVDAHAVLTGGSPTGATRLYQKVGMYPASEFVTYEKELRPGRDVDEE